MLGFDQLADLPLQCIPSVRLLQYPSKSLEFHIDRSWGRPCRNSILLISLEVEFGYFFDCLVTKHRDEMFQVVLRDLDCTLGDVEWSFVEVLLTSLSEGPSRLYSFYLIGSLLALSPNGAFDFPGQGFRLRLSAGSISTLSEAKVVPPNLRIGIHSAYRSPDPVSLKRMAMSRRNPVRCNRAGKSARVAEDRQMSVWKLIAFVQEFERSSRFARSSFLWRVSSRVRI